MSTEIPTLSPEQEVLSIRHSEFGLEKFRIQDARCNLYQGDDGIWEFVFKVQSSDALLRSKELDQTSDGKPHLEATFVLPDDKIELSEGRSIYQPDGYDRIRDENITNLYYFSHNSIEELRVELITVTTDTVDARLSGEGVINGSNGTRPDSKFSLQATFTRDPTLERSFS
jgi:hypothetical protein